MSRPMNDEEVNHPADPVESWPERREYLNNDFLKWIHDAREFSKRLEDPDFYDKFYLSQCRRDAVENYPRTDYVDDVEISLLPCSGRDESRKVVNGVLETSFRTVCIDDFTNHVNRWLPKSMESNLPSWESAMQEALGPHAEKVISGSLKQRQYVVPVTADGTNDAPALYEEIAVSPSDGIHYTAHHVRDKSGKVYYWMFEITTHTVWIHDSEELMMLSEDSDFLKKYLDSRRSRRDAVEMRSLWIDLGLQPWSSEGTDRRKVTDEDPMFARVSGSNRYQAAGLAGHERGPGALNSMLGTLMRGILLTVGFASTFLVEGVGAIAPETAPDGYYNCIRSSQAGSSTGTSWSTVTTVVLTGLLVFVPVVAGIERFMSRKRQEKIQEAGFKQLSEDFERVTSSFERGLQHLISFQNIKKDDAGTGRASIALKPHSTLDIPRDEGQTADAPGDMQQAHT